METVMGNFSRPPLETLLSNLQQGYVGLHVEQGVPVLDRDLNLLHDLITTTVRQVIARYIGDGVAAGSEGFAIATVAAENDFRILAGADGSAGSCLVGGLEVTIPGPMFYSVQPDVPALSTPDSTQPDPRTDIVYLDAFLTEIESDEDADLLNGEDVGIQTSVRIRPDWRVRVAEGVPVPAPLPGHAHTELARLVRPRGQGQIADITDLRQTRLNLGAVERRLRLLEEISLLPMFAASPDQFSPRLGEAGTPVTLFGRNFNVGTTRVLFGAVEATVVGTPTATEIQTTVPVGASTGQVQITVITDGGSTTSDDQFVVLASTPPGDPPQFAPSPDQFSPRLGTPGTPVTLFGEHFDAAGLSVQFGSVSAAVTGATATEIQVTVPTAPSGQVQITVTTDFGSVTSDDSFAILASTPPGDPPQFAPSPDQFSPRLGTPGTPVTLFGEHFDATGLSVQFGGFSAAVTSATATEIQVTVPTGASGQVQITVSTDFGSVTSDDNFVVL
jgi:hypothetical protein